MKTSPFTPALTPAFALALIPAFALALPAPLTRDAGRPSGARGADCTG